MASGNVLAHKIWSA